MQQIATVQVSRNTIMPNYDYVCLQCGDEFERFQKMTDEPLVACGKCSGQLKRLIGTGAGFVFKGAPVSETDYRLTKSYKEGESRDSSAKSGTASGTDKADGKAATTAKAEKV